MNHSSLVIRNISQISLDEMNLLLKIADVQNADVQGMSSSIIQFQTCSKTGKYADIHLLLKNPEVRDYLHEQILSKTGSHVILHLDESADSSSERDYILSKIFNLPASLNVSLLYIGGGHGGYVGLNASKKLSGLSNETIINITRALQNKNLTVDAGILHSCSSALFVKFFRPFLSKLGVLLSYSAENGSSNNWQMTVEWILDRKKNKFFSTDATAEPKLETVTAIISTRNTNRFMALESSNAGLPDYLDTSEESELQRELVMDVFLSDGIESCVETDVNQYNEDVVTRQFNKHFHDALLKNRSPRSQLIEILGKLIVNISTQGNGRKTTRNSAWKTEQLVAIQKQLETADSEETDINPYINEICTVCAKKRNILHFWAEPHSLAEFEKLLLEEGLSTSPQQHLSK